MSYGKPWKQDGGFLWNVSSFYKNVFLIFSLLIGISSFLVGNATTYYVDATSGLDTNNGTSTGTAWKTITKVGSYGIFQPGDNILFKRGETFFSTTNIVLSNSGTLGNPIIFAAYGTGEKPKIIITTTLSNLELASTGTTGWNNQGDGRWFYGYVGSTFGGLWEDGKYLEPATDENLTDGDFYWMQGSGTGVYYRPTTGTPTNHYFWKGIGSGINIHNLSYLSFYDLHFIIPGFFDAGNSGLGIYGNATTTPMSNIIFDGNEFEQSRHPLELSAQGGNILSFITINNNYFHNSAFGPGIRSSHSAGPENNTNIIISNNILSDLDTNNYFGKFSYIIAGNHADDNEGLSLENINNSLISGNTFSGGMRGGGILTWTSDKYGSGESSYTIYENNVFHDIMGVGVNVGANSKNTGNIIRNNIIYNCSPWYGYVLYGMYLQGGSGTTPPLGYSMRSYRLNGTASGNTNYFYNNIAANCYQGITSTASVEGWEVMNSIVYNPDTATTATGFFVSQEGSATIKNTYDYNMFYTPLSLLDGFSHLGKYLLSTWQSVKLRDIHSFFIDPLFSSPTPLAINDFIPNYLSRAIDTGTGTTYRTTDFAGNPIYGTPDIGAYEYQPPHRVGIDKVDISAGARIYGDGKFRDLLVVGSGVADLSVMPASGSFPLFNATDTRPEWMDISITTWSNTGTYYKEWIESSTIGSIPTLHTIGDLKANTSYIVVVDGTGSSIVGTGSTICSSGNCMSDASGSMMFIYTGGYSTHTFTITEGVQGDTTPPVITLIGSGVVNVLRGSTFVDGGATWIDTVDGSGAILSATSGSVDTNVLGSYTLTYSHTDVAGNTGSTNRSVNVITGNIPVITLIGSGTITVPFGSNYIDAGATATDLEDGNLTSSIVVNNTVNTGAIGLYTVTYDVTDTQMNQAVRVTRMVNVVTGAAPVITLIGSGTITVPFGSGYTDLGATASDLEDGNLTSSIVVNNTVNTGAIGLYTVTYDVTDAQTNQAVRVTRVVNVVDTTPPVITLIGSGVVNIYQNGSYVDSGATWTDIVDGGGTISSATSGSVNVFLTGTYTLSYTHTDVAGNTGIPVTRVVNVIPVVSTGSTSSGSTGTGSTGTGSTGTGSTGSGSTGTGTTGTGSTGTGSTGTGTTGTGSTGTGSTGSGSTGTGIITSTSPTVSPNFSGPGGGGGGGGGSSSTTSSNDNSSSNRNSTVTLSSAPVKSSLSTLSGSIIPVLSLQSYTSLSVQEATRVSTEYKESIDSLITNVESSNMRPMHVRAQQYIYGTFIGIWRDIARSSNPTGYRDAAIYLCRGMKQMSTSNIEINILNTFLRNIDTYVRL